MYTYTLIVLIHCPCFVECPFKVVWNGAEDKVDWNDRGDNPVYKTAVVIHMRVYDGGGMLNTGNGPGAQQGPDVCSFY